MALVIAAAWRLSDSGRPYLAGVVLGLSVIKPQLVLVLPQVLLSAGRWRIVLPWAAIGATLVVLSVAVLGTDGLNDYRITLAHQSQMANNRYFTLAYLLGSGALSYLGPAIVVIVAGVGAYLNRHAGYTRLFTLGVVASMLAAAYWHLQDFTVLVVAAWLFWRDHPPAWQRAWLLVVVVGGEFAWGITPLPGCAPTCRIWRRSWWLMPPTSYCSSSWSDSAPEISSHWRRPCCCWSLVPGGRTCCGRFRWPGSPRSPWASAPCLRCRIHAGWRSRPDFSRPRLPSPASASLSQWRGRCSSS